jgi:hypothetical protein
MKAIVDAADHLGAALLGIKFNEIVQGPLDMR